MIPLRDENPTRAAPVLTIALIVANVLMFIYQQSIGMERSAWVYGLIPAELLQGRDVVQIGTGGQLENLEPTWITLFTSMFMHGGWLHIIGNMWFLWIFGNNVEDDMGKVKFIFFYLAAGLAAAGAQMLLNPDSRIPMIGASGAVAGVLGAYLVLFPGSRIVCLLLTFVITVIEVPAWVVLGLWFLLELLRGLTTLGAGDVGGVAYGAHVGGFIFGLLLGRVLGVVRPARHRSREARHDYSDWR